MSVSGRWVWSARTNGSIHVNELVVAVEFVGLGGDGVSVLLRAFSGRHGRRRRYQTRRSGGGRGRGLAGWQM